MNNALETVPTKSDSMSRVLVAVALSTTVSGLVVVGCGEEKAKPATSGTAEQPIKKVETEVVATKKVEEKKEEKPKVDPNSSFGLVSLSKIFQPDPHVVSGTAGGATNVAEMQPSCKGWVSESPDHVFVAEEAFAELRVMAHSEGDVSLVIQRPDGSYLCNDDFVESSTDPVVVGNFPAGRYKIWVGSFEKETNSDYLLGFSELPHEPAEMQKPSVGAM